MARILIIEPEKRIRDMYEDLTISAGFDVISVEKTKDALSFIYKEHPSVIIISGENHEIVDLIKTVRSVKDLKVATIPIIVILEDITNNSKVYLEAGANKCLTKFPESGGKLVEEIRKVSVQGLLKKP